MTSSGLLDKAKAREDEIAEAADAELVATSDALAKETSAAVTTPGGDGPSSSLIGLLGDRKNTAIGVVVLLLIAFVGYEIAAGFSFGSGSMTITSHDIDEEEDLLKVKINFGTSMLGGVDKSAVSISIKYDGEEVWSGEKTPQSTSMWVDIPFAEFYQGNSKAAASDGANIPYIVSASQGDSTSRDYPIEPADVMDRTISAGTGEFLMVTSNDDSPNGDACGTGICHDGVVLRVSMGVQDPVNPDMISQIYSDYTVNAKILFDGDDNPETANLEVYTYPQITVDGDSAQWSSADLLSGASVVQGSWLQLSGTLLDDDGFEFIERDDFYDQGDGCYRIEIQIELEDKFDPANLGIQTFLSPGFYLHWEENENPDATTYQPTGDC